MKDKDNRNATKKIRRMSPLSAEAGKVCSRARLGPGSLLEVLLEGL
jgi:hypothetical protein